MQVSVLDFNCSGGSVAYVINIEKLDEVHNLVTWKVHRHYHQFVALRRKLRERFPSCIIPPLPSKTSLVTSFRDRLRTSVPHLEGFGGQENGVNLPSSSLRLIGSRCCALELFLRHILNHRHISEDVVLFEFLCDEPRLLKIPKTPTHANVANTPWQQVASNNRTPSLDSQRRSDYPPDGDHTVDVGASPGGGECQSETVPTSSPFVMHSSLLSSRAAAMKTYWGKLSMLISKLDNMSLRSHHKHRLLSDALLEWTPYESKFSSQDTDAILTVSNKWRHYASLMDTAEEESAKLQEHCLLWRNYADVSLSELHHIYKNTQTNMAGGHQLTLQNQNVENTRHIVDEVVAFEKLQLNGTNDVFKEFATIKLRQAERCSLIWEKILSVLQPLKDNATSD